MKMLMFDFRDTEKEFFETNELRDFQIKFFKESLTEKTELSEDDYNNTDIISVFTLSQLKSGVLSKFKNLRVIATRSTAYSHIDTEYCINKNIAVLNVENYGSTSVAQYTIGLMFALVRNIFSAYIGIKRNEVNLSEYEGRNLNSLTVGIIGCGAIGSTVAKICKFFGMRVLIYSINKKKELEDSCEFVSFEKLLEESDIISLHIPYTEENYHLISQEEIDKMKDGVILINTARGELIDIKALYENLKNRKIRAVGLDVLECEFSNTMELSEFIDNSDSQCMETALFTQKLLEMKNVIITPHIAYNTTESVNYILKTTINNIRDYMKGMNSNRVC